MIHKIFRVWEVCFLGIVEGWEDFGNPDNLENVEDFRRSGEFRGVRKIMSIRRISEGKPQNAPNL